jgi:hypothetical protein
MYLSDPFRWPDIYRINTEVVEDPHWIYPGEVLKIPGTAQLVADDNLTPPSQPESGPSESTGPTVFSQGLMRQRLSGSRFAATAAEYPHAVVRSGEFYAAPWIDRVGGPEGKGAVLANADIPGIVRASEQRRLMPHDRAYISLPKGVVAARGDLFVVVAEGPEVRDGGQLMTPTGIVQVERADNGDATTVEVVEQFGTMELGQDVVPLERFSMPVEARPSPIMLGTESKVIYVPSNVVLPSIGHYVILDATSKDGVKLGDHFLLYRPRVHLDVQGQSKPAVLPEEPIAIAQVVRVTALGATALIVDQRQPSIEEGVHARLTSRMP